MPHWTLAALLGGALALRLAFLAAHVRDLESLWYDYERRGPRFRLARALDLATLGAFLAVGVWALWTADADDSYRLGKYFVVWLGWSLLSRLSVHRFPRTNVGRAYDEARFTLVVHLVLSVVVALALTGAMWVYFWWRGLRDRRRTPVAADLRTCRYAQVRRPGPTGRSRPPIETQAPRSRKGDTSGAAVGSLGSLASGNEISPTPHFTCASVSRLPTVAALRRLAALRPVVAGVVAGVIAGGCAGGNAMTRDSRRGRHGPAVGWRPGRPRGRSVVSEQVAPPADRPGVGKIVLTLVVTAVFAVRAVRWWLGVAASTTNPEAMTTWGWIRLGFVHVAAVGGLVVVAAMIRARLRTPASPPDAVPDRPPTGEA